MNKELLLQQIKTLAQQHLLTRKEVNAIFDTVEPTKLNLIHILYYLGGAIVFLGIAIFCEQNWAVLSSIAKILITLGSGITAYYVAVLLSYEKRLSSVANGFYLIANLILPTGLWVLYEQAGFALANAGLQSFIFGLLLLLQLISYLIFRRTIFVLFAIIFATALFLCLTNTIVSKSFAENETFIQYRVLLVGLSYLWLGYYFARFKTIPLSGVLYGFGSVAFLSAGMFLSGWEPKQNIVWELIFPCLTFGLMFLSAYLRSKVLLVFSAIYLMFYICKITAEYFTASMGWPFALVLSGLMLIVVGGLALHFHKKYVLSPDKS